MRKQAKSQWDFGELFPPEPRGAGRPSGEDAPPAAPARKVLSVSELTGQLKRLLELQVGQVWVTGEVTNLRAQSSGHRYFTLKDAGAQLSCVLFRGEPVPRRELLQDGQKLLLQGDVTVYEARGQYQLIVRAVELQGIGALQIAFEKLKQKLQAEGLFAQERKRPLPNYPQRIGLVTSPTGAAIRDVLHVVRRRNPGLEIILAPCRVQGEGAALEIAAAIRLLNEYSRLAAPSNPLTVFPEHAPTLQRSNAPTNLNLILVTRGGGSIEDLWAFNEEAVARAIFESALPVISAVGHEIDFTISDFVADLRAATPSAAAEIITEGMFASGEFVAGSGDVMRRLVRQRVERRQTEFGGLAQRLSRRHPRRRLDELMQRLDDLQAGLRRCTRQGTRQQSLALNQLGERLLRSRPGTWLKRRREVCEQSSRRLRDQVQRLLLDRRTSLKLLRSRLQLLGPEQVLARGYSITMDAATGGVLRRAGDTKAGQKLKTQLARGKVFSTVERTA